MPKRTTPRTHDSKVNRRLNRMKISSPAMGEIVDASSTTSREGTPTMTPGPSSTASDAASDAGTQTPDDNNDEIDTHVAAGQELLALDSDMVMILAEHPGKPHMIHRHVLLKACPKFGDELRNQTHLATPEIDCTHQHFEIAAFIEYCYSGGVKNAMSKRRQHRAFVEIVEKMLGPANMIVHGKDVPDPTVIETNHGQDLLLIPKASIDEFCTCGGEHLETANERFASMVGNT
ncbi:hypothetical protein B9Z65_7025 [Elsinoe australis]|uniref:BTB domain-containing protein n=1 Tax=Elsinoe australis TaxID=40998 RepID=A0A2P7Z4E6_9PEZI|nr:hypothetical protein B9Z65_7025 [Elsinoe australis]